MVEMNRVVPLTRNEKVFYYEDPLDHVSTPIISQSRALCNHFSRNYFLTVSSLYFRDIFVSPFQVTSTFCEALYPAVAGYICILYSFTFHPPLAFPTIYHYL